MKISELVIAMIHEIPVEYDGSRYRYINSIIFGKGDTGKPKLSVALMDLNRNSVVIVPLKKVKLLKELPKYTSKQYGELINDFEKAS